MSMRLLIALALATAPFAYAHEPAGTFKNYCEDPSEWGTHDYVVAVGFATFLPQDGNIGGDCDGDTVPADYDGHVEWAAGGSWLSVNSGDGATGGSLACYGEEGHHPDFGPFTVTDFVLGRTLPFRVESDTASLVPPTDPTAPACGDFQTDASTLCVDTCIVTFPPGLDGVYYVFVGDVVSGAVGTLGHVSSGGGFTGTPHDWGNAPRGGHCVVNAGTCRGHCTINAGYCGKGGDCTINLAVCD